MKIGEALVKNGSIAPKQLGIALDIIIGISLLLCAVMAFKIIKTDKLIKGSEKELASITKKIDYNYIKNLKEKINSLTNAK
ncbi:MAG: hypothetical protein NT066_05465 [Candidatus Omnitrophica bacterium]|nr:hypothetical protein [Candidatus Omnitrophota bacterium]